MLLLHFIDQGMEIPVRPGAELVNQFEWIYTRPVQSGAPMKVRSADTPRHSRQSDHIAFLHFVSFGHFEFRKMKVHCVQASAMIDHQAVPAEEKIAHESDSTTIAGENFGPLRHSEIHSGMGGARRSVDDPSVSERRADVRLRGADERTLP